MTRKTIRLKPGDFNRWRLLMYIEGYLIMEGKIKDPRKKAEHEPVSDVVKAV